ncbi:MAG: amidase [Chloroflexi bacterium RBG_16_54_18]|nr:MAG: amidase [Chloroflexi bacterium RBG_16_54_18]
MSRDTSLVGLYLHEAGDLVRAGKISPVELIQAHLDRIEQLDGKINSFITLTADSALQQAALAQEEARRGETLDGKPLGKFHGLPLALKDLYETRGVRTTAGSRFFQAYIPQADARVVENLSAAGAIFLGKLNMHEIALGLTNANPHFGACHNPWALDRVPGGSSGGSAAALAAGFCLGALGSDTGGSIRVPASLCGIVGLKPTRGRVSLRGVIPLSWNLDHAGPMARCVRDVALLLEVIAGYDPKDPMSIDAPVDDYSIQIEDGVYGWRIGLADDDHFTQADPDILQSVHQAAQVFEALGAIVEPVSFPRGAEAYQANTLMVASDAAAYHRQRLEESPDEFGKDVRSRLRSGRAFTSTEYSLARRTQAEIYRQSELFFKRYDILITPTTAVPAPPIEGPDAIVQARLLTRFTAPFNLTGQPAISVPCGFSPDRLPIGMQLIAPAWQEQKLLRAAYAFEQATEWHQAGFPI